MTDKIPVFLASDNNYAPYVATTMASICYNTKSFIEFYILESDICDFRKRQIVDLKEKFDNFSVEFIKIDLDYYFKGLKANGHISVDMFSRVLVPFVKPEIKRAIYSDVDVIFMQDISILYNEDLQGMILGGLNAETITNDNIEGLKNKKKLLDMEEKDEYLASGCLLINCEKYRDSVTIEQINKVLLDYKNIEYFNDQDVLNKCCTGKILKLNLKYCVSNRDTGYKDNLEYLFGTGTDLLKEAKNGLKNPFIRHYEGLEKPWLTNKIQNKKMLYFEEFWFFAGMTKFYEGLLNNFITSFIGSEKNKAYKKDIKLFNFMPLLRIRKKKNIIIVKLFNILPIAKITTKK